MGEKRNTNTGRIVAVVLLFLFLKTSAAFLQSTKPAPKLPDLIPYRKGSKWGFCDKNKKIVIEPKYDAVKTFLKEGFAKVKLNGKIGYINAQGKEVIPIKYDDELSAAFYEGLLEVKLNGKTGYVDESGNEVIPPKYDWGTPFRDGMAHVYSNGKDVFIDKTGKELFVSKYDEMYGFDNDLAVVILDGEYGLIDKKGNEVAPVQYEVIDYFPAVADLKQEAVYIFRQGRKYGFMNLEGKIFIPAKYDAASPFHDGLAEVKLDGKWGFIDVTGKEVIPLIYTYTWGFQDGFASVNKGGKPDKDGNIKGGKWGFIDKAGNVVIPFRYDLASWFREGFAMVEKNGKYGFVDKTGKEICPLKYDSVDDFDFGLARVTLIKKMGFVDKQGKEIIPAKYDEVYKPYKPEEGVVRVRIGEKWGFVDNTGKEIVPPIYDSVGDFSEGLGIVELDDKEGFVDKTGKVVISLKYDAAFVFRNGLAEVRLNGKSGYIDANGVEYFDEGTAGSTISGEVLCNPESDLTLTPNFPAEPPESVLKTLQTLIVNGDYETVYDLLSCEDKKMFDGRAKEFTDKEYQIYFSGLIDDLKKHGVKDEVIKNPQGRDMLRIGLAIMQIFSENLTGNKENPFINTYQWLKSAFANLKLISIEISEDSRTAIIETQVGKDEIERFVLVREGGQWKFSLLKSRYGH